MYILYINIILDWTGLIGLQKGESKSSPKIFGLEKLSPSPVQKNLSLVRQVWTGFYYGLFAVRLQSYARYHQNSLKIKAIRYHS